MCFVLQTNYSTGKTSGVHREWANLGFIRAICVSSPMCRALSSQPWLDLLFTLASSPDASVKLPTQVRHGCLVIY